MTHTITVLFVPGFQEGLVDRDYTAVMTAIERLGYEARFIPMQWQRTTQVGWRRQLHEQYSLCDPARTILAGFSFGACVALMVAVDKNPRELWLCSLSPLFAEFETDWSQEDWRIVGKRRLMMAQHTSLERFASRINCPTTLFLGSQEMEQDPVMRRVVDVAMGQLADARVVIADGAGHAIDHPAYLAALSHMGSETT